VPSIHLRATGSEAGSNNTFRLYVHRESGRLIGLCAELRAIIEGATVEEILATAKTLIAGSGGKSGSASPRITMRVGSNSRSSKASRIANPAK
jgi:hypothetical protein